MQTITAQECARASRELFFKGKLGAQNHEDCLYIYDDGSRCAVGAALTDETIGRIPGSLSFERINQVVRDGFVGVEDGEIQSVEKLQDRHDQWAQSQRDADMISFLNLMDELDPGTYVADGVYPYHKLSEALQHHTVADITFSH